ncbi:hypothetical protein V8G54_011145 [Vigna mungo]|uniref:Uncharacterized protein n=1 Tax=Vigna mungo TaxID=3915 RepID=A0AAQ3S2T1_VIGMU
MSRFSSCVTFVRFPCFAGLRSNFASLWYDRKGAEKGEEEKRTASACSKRTCIIIQLVLGIAMTFERAESEECSLLLLPSVLFLGSNPLLRDCLCALLRDCSAPSSFMSLSPSRDPPLRATEPLKGSVPQGRPLTFDIVKQHEQNAYGDDAFARLYAAAESSIQTTLNVPFSSLPFSSSSSLFFPCCYSSKFIAPLCFNAKIRGCFHGDRQGSCCSFECGDSGDVGHHAESLEIVFLEASGDRRRTEGKTVGRVKKKEESSVVKGQIQARKMFEREKVKSVCESNKKTVKQGRMVASSYNGGGDVRKRLLPDGGSEIRVKKRRRMIKETKHIIWICNTLNDTHNQDGIAHNGGLVPLLKLLDSKNGSLQHNAAFALYSLADNEDNVYDFIRVGGVQRLQDGEFIVQDRPSTKVHAPPGGGSSLGYLFGGPPGN